MKKINSSLLVLRICYWTGILLDAGAAILLMFPTLYAGFYGWAHFVPSPELTSISWIGAGLMWGWTFLLFWANRKPFERRAILLLTVFPVLGVFIVKDLLDAWAGLGPFNLLTNLRLYLILLFSFGYWVGGKDGEAKSGLA
jgi:hypothetical protein